MSDNLLLTSLWLVPLIGLVAVLILPKPAEPAVKWVALGFTSATFVITLVVLAAFLRGGLQDKSLAERVAQQVDLRPQRGLLPGGRVGGRVRSGCTSPMDSLFQHPILSGGRWD